MEYYDEDADAWFYLTTLNTPRFGAMAACVGDRIYIAGGIGDSQEIPSAVHVLKSVVSFHLPTKRYSESPF